MNIITQNTIEAYTKLTRILNKLQGIIQEPIEKNRFVVDATIKRFSLSFIALEDLLKALLLDYDEVKANNSKTIFKKACKADLINNKGSWIKMYKDRKKISYVYCDEIVDKIYTRIPEHLTVMQKIHTQLAEKLEL